MAQNKLFSPIQEELLTILEISELISIRKKIFLKISRLTQQMRIIGKYKIIIANLTGKML